MTEHRYKVVGIGEILWDLLPAGRQLGGAPSNFAYIAQLLGNEGIVASRVGSDALGQEAAERLSQLGLSTAVLQCDPVHATGTVQVEVDAAGQPRFEIAENVAWDFLEWTPDWQRLAAEADAVCFGSLAQRSAVSRATLLRFLRAMRSSAVRIFDVNLRQSFFRREILVESLLLADILKLNHEELPRLLDVLGLPRAEEQAAARLVASRYHLQQVCITRGANGSVLFAGEAVSEHPGYRVQVADTVGAGDAFTAALVHEYLRGASIDNMNNAANRVGSWVASQVGATPVPIPNLQQALAEIVRPSD